MYKLIIFGSLVFLFTGGTPSEPASVTAACTQTGDYLDNDVEYYTCPVDVTSKFTIFCSDMGGTFECMKVLHKPGEPRE